MNKFIFALLFTIIFTLSAIAQKTNDDDDFQSWNDLQLTVSMAQKVDFFTQLTGRLGNNLTQFTDGRIAFGFVLKPTKSFSVTPFYWYIRARNASGAFRTENELNLRGVYRFPTKGFGLSHRSQYEYRMRSPRNSWRYRAMLTVD